MQNRPNGDVGITSGVVGSTAPAYDVTNGRPGRYHQRCPRTLTNLQDGKIRFSINYDRKFETFQHLATNNGMRQCIILMTVRNRCLFVWSRFRPGANCTTTLSGAPLALGEETIRYSAEVSHRASRSLSCVKKYSCITVLKNLSTLAGTARLMWR